MSEARIFSAEIVGDTLVVAPLTNVGSLAGEQVDFELNEFLGQLARPEVNNAVIDMQRCSYFGTAMLQVMTAVWKRVRTGGGKMAICNVSEVGREILEVSRFDTLWPVCSSRSEALRVVDL